MVKVMEYIDIGMKNGQLCYEWNYRDERKNGSCKSWDENGNLVDEKIYVDNVEQA